MASQPASPPSPAPLPLSLTLPHYPAHPLHIALYSDVTNASALLARLQAADPAYDYAFLDAAMVLSARHLLLAAALALQAHLHGTMKTRTPHSELVYRLHPNNNIGEAYRKFGIADVSTDVLVVKFGQHEPPSADRVASHLADAVRGTAVDLGADGERLGAAADEARIRSVYKVPAVGGRGGKRVVDGNGHAGDERARLESVILGTMTLKGS